MTFEDIVKKLPFPLEAYHPDVTDGPTYSLAMSIVFHVLKETHRNTEARRILRRVGYHIRRQEMSAIA